MRRLPVWIDFSKKLKPSQVVSVFPNSVEVEIESVEVETENSAEVKTDRKATERVQDFSSSHPELFEMADDILPGSVQDQGNSVIQPPILQL